MLTKEWIGGFISGEGCFTFFNDYTPVCQITLSKKDTDILYEIQKTLQLGKVSLNKNAIFKVSKKDNCLKLINMLNNNIYGDKLIDYENWKIGINFLINKPKYEKLSKEDKMFIYSLKPKQNKIRKIFCKNDIPSYIKITKICEACKKKFFSDSGLDIFCDECKGPFNFYSKQYYRKKKH